MATYRELMKEAVNRSERWGLECLSTQMMGDVLTAPEPKERLGRQKALWDYFEALSRQLPYPPDERANACAAVHPSTASYLMKIGFKQLPFITIGDVVWDGDSCFHVTEQSLKECLDAGPAKELKIGFHAWITFPDLSILDLTFVPWQCRHNKEPFNLNEPGGLGLFGVPEDIRARFKIVHQPKLVGPELLWRTEAAPEVLHEEHQLAEQAWYEEMSLAVQAGRAPGVVGRNDPCPCGSGKKFKKCCLAMSPG